MLTRKCAILASSLLLVGCGKWLPIDFPEFPQQIKAEHLIVVKGEKAYCFLMEIESLFPRKFKDPKSVPLSECNELSGLLPDEALSVDNWMHDVYRWGKENKCYKQ